MHVILSKQEQQILWHLRGHIVKHTGRKISVREVLNQIITDTGEHLYNLKANNKTYANTANSGRT